MQCSSYNLRKAIPYLTITKHFVDLYQHIRARVQIISYIMARQLLWKSSYSWCCIHCHWRRRPWQRVDVFQYSSSSRKIVAFFINICERGETKTIARNALQQSRLLIGVIFSYPQLFPICILREFKQVDFSLVNFLTNSGKKIQ